MSDERFSPEQFGAAYQRFTEWVSRAEESERSPFKAVLRARFGQGNAAHPAASPSRSITSGFLTLRHLTSRWRVRERVRCAAWTSASPART
jgi:hypothetical protein